METVDQTWRDTVSGTLQERYLRASYEHFQGSNTRLLPGHGGEVGPEEIEAFSDLPRAILSVAA